MTELVLLRLMVGAAIVWFIASEWFHAKQLDHAYNRGFLKARKVFMKHHSKFLEEIYADIDLLQKEFNQIEQTNAQGAGTSGFSKIAGIDSAANDVESSQPSGEGHHETGRGRED